MMFMVSFSFSQAPQLKFLHTVIEDGLPDGTVRGITQDKYGYAWLGTQYGLCRYDGYNMRSFFHQRGDSNSLAGNFIWSAFTDSDGDVWVCDDGFLSMYNYSTNNFTNYRPGLNANVQKIAQDEKGMFWLATSAGLMKFDKNKKQFFDLKKIIAEWQKDVNEPIFDLALDRKDGCIYLATRYGIRVFDYRNEKMLAPFVPLDKDPYEINRKYITAITKDNNGNLWFGCGLSNAVLVKWNSHSKTTRYYNNFSDTSAGWAENRIVYLFADRDENVWIGGTVSSLGLYLPAKDSFCHYKNDPLIRSSIAGINISCIYQDDAGLIWVGAQGYGVDRFNAKNNHFTSFQPQAAIQPSLLDDWGRAAIEDRHGNFWFGTSKGVSVYAPSTGTYKNYFNDKKNPSLISYNTIRSLLEDKKGNIWIGTGNGLTRFDPNTGRFKNYWAQDSLKSYFIWSLLQVQNGQIYIGGTGGLQRYDEASDKFKPADDDTSINRKIQYNIRNIFEDSRQRLWLGAYDKGLICYDPKMKTVVHYRHYETNPISISSNFVTAVTEDKNGIIWIATRSGLNKMEAATKSFTLFSTIDGLPSNKTSALRVDDKNNLWIGTGNGLSMLDTARHRFRNYNIGDGLPTDEFNDQVAATTSDGRFIYPTFRGFVVFKPGDLQQRILGSPVVHTTGFTVFDKPILPGIIPEEIKTLNLKYNENFFSIELTAFNYETPDKILYAYKLEPFDKNWKYTEDRNISYTNVPGGKYIFYYKASMDPSNWNVPVKQLQVNVDTVFFKSIWFQVLVVLLIAAVVYGIYSYRLRQTRQVHRLQLQATRLEKDKTEIQYQNLINQFNPHFLFNSLTSLNSLIYENKELASEFLEQLSAVYRYLLTHKETQLVPLDAETNFVKQYIALLKTRFGKGLDVSIDIPNHLLKKRLVPVTFQLLIENAVKHNIVDESAPLQIAFTADEQYLYVSNNLQKKTYVETSNRKGLGSLQTLYKYLSSLPMLVEEGDGKFTIRIPLL